MKCVWKCLENGGHFVSALSVKPIVSAVFFPGPIGNSLALLRVVDWHRTDAKPFRNQWWPDTTYANMSVGLALCQKLSSKAYYIDTFSYIWTKISRSQRPHISNVHLWICNAHAFSACTVNPGACTDPHSPKKCFPQNAKIMLYHQNL